MGDIKPLEALLETTIKAPRLSGSKVTQISELAMGMVAHDHDIVTTFFKLNNSLPPATQARISSLYVFDAIARAARNAVNKGKGRETRTERGKGTQGSLLIKLEGVVGSWVNGMIDDGRGGIWNEGKEKVRKIIDIWAKHGTFPQSCLDELSVKVVNATPQAGPSGTSSAAVAQRSPALAQGFNQGSTTPPLPPPAAPAAPLISAHAGGLPPEILKMLGMQAAPIAAASPTAQSGIPISAPAPAPASVPAPVLGGLDLQALLASVVSVNQAIPPTSSASVPVPLDAAGGKPNLNQNQMNALAKFAALAQAGPQSTNPPLHVPPMPPRPPPQSQPMPQFIPGQPVPTHDGHGGDRYDAHRNAQIPGNQPGARGLSPIRRESHGYPGQGREPPARWEGRYDDRSGDRGGYNGAPGHGAQQDRPPHRGGYNNTRGRGGRPSFDGRDRSRSPPHRDGPGLSGRGRFEPRFNNGHNSSGSFDSSYSDQTRNAPPQRPQQGPAPPRPLMQGAPAQGLPPQGRAPPPDWMTRDHDESSTKAAPVGDEGGEADMALDDSDDEMNGKPAPAHVSSAPLAPAPAPAPSLETFDMTTFDPSSPEAWARLAKAWQVSTGVEPDQMMLMNWVMMRMQAGVVG